MSDPIARLNAALEGRYALERELGRGGMATVYLADDLKHERKVALKVLKPELAAAVGTKRFLVEIKTTANLHHPHILPLFDSGEGDGLLYYAMPYIQGESVRDKLKREKQLSIDEAVHIASEVADALSYAHGQGVIHRDIKPSNILLDSGHAVIADFGIALMVHTVATDRLSGSGISPGSPVYMSPEQAAGDAPVDARSDVYSLGCVLYEMLVGDPPFTGSIPQVIFARKLVEPPPRLSVVRDAVPDHVDRATARALASTPSDRFDDAGEFAQALAGHNGRPQVGPGLWDAEATEAGETRWVSGPKLLVAASIAVVLFTLALLVF